MHGSFSSRKYTAVKIKGLIQMNTSHIPIAAICRLNTTFNLFKDKLNLLKNDSASLHTELMLAISDEYFNSHIQDARSNPPTEHYIPFIKIILLTEDSALSHTELMLAISDEYFKHPGRAPQSTDRTLHSIYRDNSAYRGLGLITYRADACYSRNEYFSHSRRAQQSDQT